MLELSLFLGFSPDETFKEQLLKANPYLVSQFIGKPDYLREIIHLGKTYLGKYIDGYPTLEELKDLEKHIISLLLQLTPKYVFASNPAVLIAVPKNSKV